MGAAVGGGKLGRSARCGWLPLASALLGLGCSSFSYEVAPGRLAPQRLEGVATPEHGAYRVSQELRGDWLRVKLEPGACTTSFTEQPLETRTTKRHTSFWGGPGLTLAGVALAGVGSALVVAANEPSGACSSDAAQCASHDRAVALGAASLGLGAAAVAVGLYRSFKPATVTEVRRVPVGDASVTRQIAPCPVATAGVAVWLQSAHESAARTALTNDDGWASFELGARQLTAGATAVLGVGQQRFRVVLDDPSASASPAEMLPAPPRDAACQSGAAPSADPALDGCDADADSAPRAMR